MTLIPSTLSTLADALRDLSADSDCNVTTSTINGHVQVALHGPRAVEALDTLAAEARVEVWRRGPYGDPPQSHREAKVGGVRVVAHEVTP